MELSTAELEQVLTEHYGRRRLRIKKDDDVEAKILTIVEQDLGDFCWSLDFDESFLQRLLGHGFLPICTRLPIQWLASGCVYVLLPKLHRSRCVLRNLGSIHLDRGARKRSRKCRLTANGAFNAVVEACIEQHGESWLWPPMREALQRLHQRTSGAASSKAPSARELVELHSVELWAEDGRLVAGELGYTCGSMYTSLTGFFRESSMGTVQLLALAGLLLESGFACWDLGMTMGYKDRLGAENVDRPEFIALQRSLRQETSARLSTTIRSFETARPAAALIDALRANRNDDSVGKPPP